MRATTLTTAGKKLGISRTSVRRATLAGILTPVYGGIFGQRLVGVTDESIEKLLSLRQMNRAINDKEVQA